MSDSAYRSAYEEVLGKFANKDGIVIDTRFNGGGDLVADLDMFLSGKKFFDYANDKRNNGYEPNFRWAKPSISIVGEAQYCDGHCYAFAYQFLKLDNHLTEPDVKVENKKETVVAGRDEQLEAAVAELLKENK